MLRLHQRAKDEVREAATWYENQSQGLGQRFVSAVRDTLELLEKNPGQYARLETLAADLPFRRILVRGFPYLIVYEAIDHDVFVYAVAHASRRPSYWRRRKRTNSGD